MVVKGKSAGRKVRTPSKMKQDLAKPTNRKEPPRAPLTVFKGDTSVQQQETEGIYQTYELPEPPDSLKETGRQKWVQFGLSLQARNMLSEHYLPSLEHLCRLHDQLAQIEEEMSDGNGGSILMVQSSWGPKLNPLVAIRNTTMLLIRTMLTDFGMTPTSTRGAAPASGAEPARKNGGVPRRNRLAVPAGI